MLLREGNPYPGTAPRARRFVALALLAACLLLAPPAAQAGERVRVQLKWVHQFQFAGYYAALSQGYYREAGLDVTLMPGEPDLDPADVVLAGRAEYGVGTPEVLLDYAHGKPLLVLAVIFQHSPYIFLSLEDSGIDDIVDLAGRKVMIEPQSAELYAYLHREQVPVNDLTLLPHTFSPQTLVKKEADAMSAYVTTEPYELARDGVPYSSFNPRSSGVDFYGDLLFTTQTHARRQSAQVKAFRAATLRGWDYAFKHEQEIIDLIVRDYDPTKDRGALEFEAREMRKLIHPEIIPIGYMYEGRWQHIEETYRELGMLKGEVNLGHFLYDPDPKPDYSWVYWLAGAALFTILGAVAVLLPLWRMNRNLRHARDHAESANRAKERFVAMVSHELRTPMNGVMGFTSLLHRTPLNPEQAEYVRLIETSTASLSELISDLLDFSRIEAGRVELEIIPFHLRGALEDLVQFFAPMADKKDILLRYDPREPLPHYVLGDPARLRQILMNLLGNAIKFTDVGAVTLGVQVEEILETRAKGPATPWLQFIVRDTGAGMGEEELARAFEPYAQANASIRRRYGGTGLGLAISRRLATQMGGHLVLSSTPGKGTLAVLRLPLEPAEAPAAPPIPEPDPVPALPVEPHKLHILVAEDDKISSRLMLTLLRKLGHETEGVETGRLALEYWREKAPDLIFMDMQMPEMGGLEAITEIRKAEPALERKKRVLLVALSASAQDQIQLACLAAGADTYLTKPITLPKIQSTLEELLEE
jgi:signal transduction histidine kinase/CheY-like chemotaxis protein